MIKQPAYLKKGDKIAIVCPAKKLPKRIDDAIRILENWGLEVILGKSVYAAYHQFAGDDTLRTEDIQAFLDNTDIKAIIAARGGYGTIRIIDQLDFTKFQQNPKWIIGFSDVTVLLSHLFAQYEIQSIHGQMPIVFDQASSESLESLRRSLFGEQLCYTYTSNFNNRSGSTAGILIGGNLTLLVMLEGSPSAINYKDKILFLEDVGESESSIDRMMYMLKRSGKLSQLKGLVVGAFNEVKAEEIPFGLSSPEQVIWNVVKEYNYPVCFNFPAGHIDDNKALIIGQTANLSIKQQTVFLEIVK